MGGDVEARLGAKLVIDMIRQGSDSETHGRNPVQFLIRATIWVFVLLLLLYLGVQTAFTFLIIAYPSNAQYQTALVPLLTSIASVGSAAWDFVRPLLQLGVVLLIVDWLLGRFGFSLAGRRNSRLDWNIQTIIALMVVGAFAIAALGGLAGVSALKDLALVVVGFYFGTQKKSVEVESEKGKVTVVEEHQNEVRVKQEEIEEREEPENKRD